MQNSDSKARGQTCGSANTHGRVSSDNMQMMVFQAFAIRFRSYASRRNIINLAANLGKGLNKVSAICKIDPSVCSNKSKY